MSFEEKGWRGATFEHIAERAGVTRGALHHHFRDKRALLVEALEWGWSDYGWRLFEGPAAADGAADSIDAGGAAADGADTAAAADGRPQLTVEELLARFVRMITRDSTFRALASTTVLVAPQALDHSEKSEKDGALDDWRERIEGIVVASGGGAARLAPRDVAGLVLVLLQGFTLAAVTRPDDLPQPDELDAAMAALVRGLLDT